MTERNCSRRLPGGGHGGAHAGVVDQHVDVAELGHRRVDQRLALVGVGDVGLHREHPAAGVAHQLGRLLQPVGTAGAEDHVGAGLGQPAGEGHAQAAGGAGHDGDLVVEPEHVGSRHGRDPTHPALRAPAPVDP